MDKPFNPRKGYADSRLGQIHYVEVGKGPALILIPHSGRSWRMFADLASMLSARHRVIVFDVPGTGGSVQPTGGDIGVSDLADAFMDALDHLAVERFTLFGLHGGNKIGASMAVRHPTRVQAFVYAGQSHSIVVSKDKRAQVFAATPCINTVVSTTEASADSREMWAREFVDLTSIWWDDHAVGTLSAAQRNRVVGRAVDSLQSFEWRPFFYKATSAYDMERDLRQIEVPTLILELATPAEDRTVGRQGQDLLATIKNSRLTTLEFSDRFVVTLEDRAAEVAAIVDSFLLQTVR